MRKPIAIVAAMAEECEAVLARFTSCSTRRHFHLDMHLARHGNQEVVIARSGVGKVNAASALALLLSDFDVGCVINIGSAGGLQMGQHVLDLVVPHEVVYTDVDVVSLGCAYGQMYGEPARFQANSRLLALFDDLVAAGRVPHTRHHGLLGSSDAMIYRPDQVDFIRKTFNNEIQCVEMEGGAIAHVCTQFHVPFLILRALSDTPGQGDSLQDFQSFLRQASAISANICLELVQKLEQIEQL